jgi:hypothetical protein
MLLLLLNNIKDSILFGNFLYVIKLIYPVYYSHKPSIHNFRLSKVASSLF